MNQKAQSVKQRIREVFRQDWEETKQVYAQGIAYFKTKKSRILLYIAILCGAAAIAAAIPGKIILSQSSSQQYRVFFMVTYDHKKPLKNGDFVTIPRDPEWEKRLQADWGNVPYFLKRIGCSPGDILTVQDKHYFCNSQWLVQAKDKTKKGIPLTPFIYNGPVPPGMVFLVGDNLNGFDSRYMGFVPYEKIRHRVFPLF